MMKIKKSKLQEIIKEELVNIIAERIYEDKTLNESLSAKDYKEIKDLIRAEVAAIMFDLFKKRQIWV